MPPKQQTVSLLSFFKSRRPTEKENSIDQHKTDEQDIVVVEDSDDDEPMIIEESRMSPSIDKNSEDSCPICGKNISKLNAMQRNAHCNICCDTSSDSIRPVGPSFKQDKSSIRPSRLSLPKLSSPVPQVRLQEAKDCESMSANEATASKKEDAKLTRTPIKRQSDPSLSTKRQQTQTKPINNLSLLIQESTPSRSPAPRRSLSKNRNGFCPLQHQIPGTSLIVDGFKYACPQLSSIYLLTHFHSDHYGGLTKSFNYGTIYCSEVTRNLLISQLHIDASKIVSVPLSTPFEIYDPEYHYTITLTAMDANHCPGACMYLVKVQNSVFLRTGDFRYIPDLIDHSVLKDYTKDSKNAIDCIYLDNTYSEEKYDFPSQERVVNYITSVVKAHIEELSLSKLMILIGGYSIGKERIYFDLIQKLHVFVYVDSKRYKRLCDMNLEPLYYKYITTDITKANVRIVFMNLVSFPNVRLFQSKNPQYERILAIEPSGWNNVPSRTLETHKPYVFKSMYFYRVPYSEHSSFSELQAFLRRMKYKSVYMIEHTGDTKLLQKLEGKKENSHRITDYW